MSADLEPKPFTLALGNAATRINKLTRAELLDGIQGLKSLLRSVCEECQTLIGKGDDNEHADCTPQTLRKKHIEMQTHVCAVRRAVECVRDWDSDGRDKAPGTVLVPCIAPHTTYFSDQFSHIYDADKRWVTPAQQYVVYSLRDDEGLRKRPLGHRLAHGAHFGLDDDLIIDHGDQCKTNNCLTNLEAMTRADHATKTLSENPHIVEKYHDNSTQVQGTCITTGEILKYTSWTEAARKHGLDEGRQLKAYFDRGLPYDGRKWRPVTDTQEDLPGERWWEGVTNVTDPSMPVGARDLLGVTVSDMGRVLVSGKKTFGSETWTGNKHQLMFMWRGKYRHVAQAVCTVFHGPVPAPKVAALHINGNVMDNTPQNLMWVGGTRSMIPPPVWAKVPTSLAASVDDVKDTAELVLQHMLTAEELSTLRRDCVLLIDVERVISAQKWFEAHELYPSTKKTLHPGRKDSRKTNMYIPSMAKLLKHANVNQCQRSTNNCERAAWNLVKLCYQQ